MRTPRGDSRRAPDFLSPKVVAFAIALAALSWAGRSFAEPSTVALVRPTGTDELLDEATTRLRAELVAAGFDVRELVATGGANPEAEVESSGLTPAPVATVAVTGVDGALTADIWVADRATHKTVVRHVDVADVAKRRAASVLAVRAVELLRASLLEATVEPRPKKATPPKAPAPSKQPPPKATPTKADARSAQDESGTRGALRFGGELGAAALYGPGGVSPAFAPLLRLQYGTATWAGRFNLVAPAFGGSVSAAGGSATVREELASLDVTATWPERGHVAIVGSAGGGAYHWHIGGQGAGTNLGHDTERFGAVGQFGVGGVVRFSPRIGLLVDAQAIWWGPPLIVQIAGVNAGRGGQPTLCASLGLWVAL